MGRAGLSQRTVPNREMPAAGQVKWPKWALAGLFLADGAGFGTWAAHVPVFKQSLHIENGSLTLVLISVIVGALITMPVTGQLIDRKSVV